MAWLSKIKSDEGMKIGIEENISNCASCGKKIDKGGMWAFNPDVNLAICKKCAPILLDLFIDTMQDSGEYADMTDIEIMNRISDECKNRYIRKVRKKAEIHDKCTF